MSFDPIALLDAAYRPCGDARAWLGENGPRIAARFDELGIGCLTYFVRDLRFEPCDLAYRPGARRSIDPGLALDAVRRGVATASPEHARRAVLAFQQPGISGMLETFGERVFPTGAFGDDITDGPAIIVPTGERLVAVIVTFTPAVFALSREQRALWETLAIHLGTACRLSGRASDADAPDVEAVLDPSGGILDARGPARAKAARALLRESVVRRAHARTRAGRARPVEAITQWRPLFGGRWSLVDYEDGRRQLVLARRNDPDAPAADMSRRQRQVLFYASVGWSVKQIAYALGLSNGAVNNHLRVALAKAGYASRAELVRATTEAATGAPRRPRAAVLSAAERDVAELVRRGWSNQRIADHRKVSIHTVENQLRSIFGKLGVRDRHELIRELGRGAGPAGSPN